MKGVDQKGEKKSRRVLIRGGEEVMKGVDQRGRRSQEEC